MRLHIQYKISLIITVLFATILLGVFFYLNRILKDHFYLRAHQTLMQELDFARSFIDNAYQEELSVVEIDRIADTIGYKLNVRVAIMTKDGVILGDSNTPIDKIKDLENHLYRPEIQQALYKGVGESRRFSAAENQEMLHMAMAFGKQQNKGVIRLSSSLSEVESFSKYLRKTLFFSLAMAFMFSVVVGFGASLFISKPIKEISTIAKDIASGDFSRKISIKTSDEIEDLSTSINFMSDQIKSRIDEALANKSQMEAVLYSMFEGVMVVDVKGKVILMNQTLKNLFSLEQDNYFNQSPLEVIRNMDIQEMVNEALSIQGGVVSRQISVVLAEEKTFLVHGTPVIRNNKIDGAVLVFHDITHLRRLEKIRQDFVANVSHELRTPVASIKGYAETLLDGALEDKENARDFLSIINTDAERLSKLISDLLDLSRIESGKIELQMQEVSLFNLVNKVVNALKNEADKRNVKITNKISSHLSLVRADDTSMAQLFMNIIENAIKYNRPGGQVTIQAREVGSFIEVQISDTGIGIPQEDLPRIFERFYRVDKARSREIGGTGLGLSIAKHIVQSHHGEIYATSELDKGTTFYFTLPKV